MSEQKVDEIIYNTMERLKNLISTDLIFGKPIVINGDITIIPLNKISIGFVSGGGETLNIKGKLPFSGGSGSGVNMYPLGFISIIKNNLQFTSVESDFSYDKILNIINEFLINENNKKSENNAKVTSKINKD